MSIRESSTGVVIGKVTRVDDPDHHGRIQVSFPWLGEGQTSRWASVASIMAGGDRGCFFMPEVDDECILAFQQGDWDHPIIVGFLWNPVQQPPSSDERQRMIRSNNGHTIRFVDSTPNSGDMGALIIQDAHGNLITMANGRVSIRAIGHLSINAGTMSIMNRPVRPTGGTI